MSDPFPITAATNTIRLDDKRQAETSFSVFNNSGRQMRGRARIVPQDPASAKWLTLVGESERDFPISGTQEYKVSLAIPPDAPAGSYPFRLDVVGVDNPDEDLSQGPSVTFEVPALVAVKKPSFPIWIPVVIVGVLILVGIIIAFLAMRGGETTGPPTAVAQVTATSQPPLTGAARYVGDWVVSSRQPATSTLSITDMKIETTTRDMNLVVQLTDNNANPSDKTSLIGFGPFIEDPFETTIPFCFFNFDIIITPNADATRLKVNVNARAGEGATIDSPNTTLQFVRR